MEQQVNATVRLTYSADAALDRAELQQRIAADVRRLYAGTAAPAQLEIVRDHVIELHEEAAIYGNGPAPIGLAFVAAMADDCSKRTLAVPYHDAAMKAATRATDPKACRPGSPAVSNAYDEAARHSLSALYVTAPPSMTAAERLLAAAILAARAEGRDLPIDRATFQHIPAIKALQDYAAEAPAIPCAEGFWDDQESACGDGMRQSQSEAAALIRAALRSLNLEAPTGYAVCAECFQPEGDHHHSCETGQREAEEEIEELNDEADIVAGKLAIGA